MPRIDAYHSWAIVTIQGALFGRFGRRLGLVFPGCVGSPSTDMPPPLLVWCAGFRPLVRPCVTTASVHPPAVVAVPMLVQGRRPDWTFQSLFHVHSVYGLSLRRAAIRSARREGTEGFATSTIAPIATGWSGPVAEWELRPLKTNAFPRRPVAASRSPVSRGSGAAQIGGSRVRGRTASGTRTPSSTSSTIISS
jgi:hypothetical protein